MQPNFLRIVVYRDRLELSTPQPVVRAALEPLRIAVLWDDGSDVWERLEVGPFSRVDGSVVETAGAGPAFERARGSRVEDVDFRVLEPEEVLCRAPLLGTPRGGGRRAVGALVCWLHGAERGPGRDRQADGGRAQKSA